MSTCIRY